MCVVGLLWGGGGGGGSNVRESHSLGRDLSSYVTI